MINELRKIGAFLERDFRMIFTYKLAFSTMFSSTIFNLVYLVLFGTMFGQKVPNALSIYGGDFISYLLVGSIGWGFLWSISGATSASLTSEMMEGTLESILLTRTSPLTLIVSYMIFGCFFGLLSMGILLVVGWFCFGVAVFSNANIYTIIIFSLSILLMAGFGLIFAGLTIWAKNIGQLVPLVQNIAMFFCGVYFPISVLPECLQPIAKFVPFYYSIEGLRLSLAPARTIDILDHVWKLLVLSILFIILGIYTVNKGLVKAKKDGSLAFY